MIVFKVKLSYRPRGNTWTFSIPKPIATIFSNNDEKSASFFYRDRQYFVAFVKDSYLHKKLRHKAEYLLIRKISLNEKRGDNYFYKTTLPKPIADSLNMKKELDYYLHLTATELKGEKEYRAAFFKLEVERGFIEE